MVSLLHGSLRSNNHFWLVIVLMVVGIFHASTVRPGHIWGDDFAMYVHQARNIVEGRPYAETGYLFSRSCWVSPRMYPPVFPLLLAPVVRIFGLNLIPMKLEQVLFFVLALMAICLYWQRDLGRGYTLALAGIVGFSPHFWMAKDNVLSDLPFLVFFYVTAVLVRRVVPGNPTWWRWALLIGLSMYLAIGTRTAGVALIAGLVLYDLVKYRTITRVTILALLTCGGFLFLQSRLIGSGFNSYDGQLHATPRSIVEHLLAYARTLAGFWVASTHSLFSLVVIGIVSLLMLAGLLYRYKEGFTIVEAFLVPYAAVALLWPFFPGIRLVFPVIPWMVFLALRGLRGLTEQVAPRHLSAALCVFCLLIAIPYCQAYLRTDFGPIRQSTGLAEFNQLCEAVRERTTPQDVLVYFRARALALYTGRSASAYDYEGTEDELRQHLREVHATYLITTNAFDSDRGLLTRWAEENPASLDLAYENAHFHLYRIVTTSNKIAAVQHR